MTEIEKTPMQLAFERALDAIGQDKARFRKKLDTNSELTGITPLALLMLFRSGVEFEHHQQIVRSGASPKAMLEQTTFVTFAEMVRQADKQQTQLQRKGVKQYIGLSDEQVQSISDLAAERTES